MADNPRDKIEGAARKSWVDEQQSNPMGEQFVTDNEAWQSIAISLKRIADKYTQG